MKSIEIEWDGERATLTERQAFAAADAIEEHVTFGQLAQMRMDGNKVRFAQIAAAYAALLGVVGIRASAHQVHVKFKEQLRDASSADKLSATMKAIDWLLMVLMDGAPEADGDEEPAGNVEAPAS